MAQIVRPARAAPLAVGAEAELRHANFLGRPVLEKRRLPKGYRHPSLDATLRAERTRDEANLLVAARRAGVAVPLVYDVDRGAASLLIEHIVGRTLREELADRGDADGHMAALGRAVARLHDAGITHGDLTTGNVLVPAAASGVVSLVLIDFGLGAATAEAEPRGVDLHLLEEALEATEADAQAMFASFLSAYRGHAAGGREAIRRLEEIRTRGRNR
ncbi:MAG: KEOPS complex kinase/ATPase Bud32 [Thermoplasmatota archaeon]